VIPLIFALVSPDLDSVLDNPKLSGAIVSCLVAAEDGSVIFQRAPWLRMMPGSNEKLLSNSYALWKLGPEYRPQTRIWKLAYRTVVDSPGDPMMTHEQLQAAARDLSLGRRPVYVRQAYRPLIGPSWEWDDLPNRYAAPVTAFTVDRGGVEIWGGGDRLEVRPLPYWLKPRRGEKTGKRFVTYDPIRRTLTVDGELPKTMARIDTLALDQPDAAAASLLGRPIQYTEELPSTPPDLTITGPTLRETMKECLVKSDNNIAENLLLMAAAANGPLGKNPYEVAAAALTQFLIRVVGADSGDFRPQDGSGLSRHDLVTTRGIVKLLQWAVKQPTRDIWLDALVKPGAGTLESRLKDVPFVGKTGTLDTVVALSGYVRTKAGKTLKVSLIFNHFLCSETDARAIADEFITKLAAEGDIGMFSATGLVHEARPALSHDRHPDAGRIRRPDFHGLDARERTDRRAQSADAILHRPQRVAVRPR
jgi:D-alanyl-D-alanine carboxypeptidase/D-alanyl-D-alanine-endopeptidase (penicillin-binding protein 4)